MNFTNQIRNKTPGSIVALALALVLTGCGSSDGGEDTGSEIIAGDITTKGPASGSNSQGASIGISNSCVLASDTVSGKPVLRITTNIIDKSSGDTTPYFTENGTTVRAEEKGKGKPTYTQVGDAATFTSSLGVNETDIQLCKDGLTLVSNGAVSLNASISISVDNDNKGEYSSRCSDDPATDNIDEGKVLVSPVELAQACMLP